jgi:glycosyltransferase involved in cell wall biosynthesis
MSMRTLYLCYFGLLEPLVQTQVLPYLRQLAAGGIKVHLLTFEPRLREKWSKEDQMKQRERLATQGITWFCLPYHKSPSVPATAYDIMAGARFAVRLARREGLDVLHARAHIPMAMALLAAKRLSGMRIIFDIRGLMAEEYVDAGIWRERSSVFRAVKKLERKGIRRADGIVVLTQRMRDWLVGARLADAEKIEVIPCCVDLLHYEVSGQEGTVEIAATNDAESRFEVVYAGSVTGLYLLEEMGRFFLELRARRAGAFFRVLTMSSSEQAASILRRVGLSDEDFQVTGVPAAEVPALLRRARLGVSFRKATSSQIAASPTKISEYLAAGLPVVSNHGIGDIDDLLEGERVGVVVKGFDRDDLSHAADEALALAGESDIAARCREIAQRHFDLVRVGGARYLNVYRLLDRKLAHGASRYAASGDHSRQDRHQDLVNRDAK